MNMKPMKTTSMLHAYDELACVGLTSRPFPAKRGFSRAWAFLACLCLPTLASGAILMVDGTAGDDANDGHSWLTAKLTLGAALEATTEGDEIWVTRGTYVPGTSRTSSFELPVGVSVYGGFEGGEEYREDRDSNANVTILSGDLEANDDGLDNNDENAYHVVVAASRSLLDGLTITGGNANQAAEESGAGILGVGVVEFTVRHCVLSFNRAVAGANVGLGGAIFLQDSHATLEACRIEENSSIRGGGIYCWGGVLMARQCEFVANTTSGRPGGAMYAALGASVDLDACRFLENRSGYGGAIYHHSEGSLLRARNCVFAVNTCGGDSWGGTSTGGGLWVEKKARAILENCTFVANSDSHQLHSIYGYDAFLDLKNTIVWNDTGTAIGLYLSQLNVSYCDLSEGVDGVVAEGTCNIIDGGHNIAADPGFVQHPEPAASDPGDFHLQADSPCIDVGAPIEGLATDIDGEQRPFNAFATADSNGSTCDIGADEYSGHVVPVEETPMEILSAVELSWGTSAGVTYQLQSRSDVDGGLWEDLGKPFTGNGGVMSVFQSTSLSPRRFFRLLAVEP